MNIGFTKSAGSPASVTKVGSPFPFFTWCTSFFPWLWLVNKKLSARKARLAVRNWTSFGIWTWNLEWAKTFMIFWSQSGENDQKCWGSQRIEVFWKEMMVLQCYSLRASFTFLKMRISTMPLTMKKSQSSAPVDLGNFTDDVIQKISPRSGIFYRRKM